MAEKSVKETIDALEALEKSEPTEELDGIDALEKALADFSDFEDLEKSGKDDDDDSDVGDDDDDDDQGDDDDDDQGDDEGAKPVEKSVDLELEQELIKASEAYAELEERVEGFAKSVDGQLDDVRAAMADLTGLVQAIGKGVVSLSKSMRELAGQPAQPSAAVLGMGRQKTETVEKSKREVEALLKKSVVEGKVPAVWLSKVSVNGVGVLPEHIKATIGL